jgi:general secretion pathway protein G
MTAIRNTSRKGFTLVEILIVVIILGILAAIVIPQFTSASEDARKSNMRSQLQTLRSQIELYKLQHRDLPPPLTGTDWSAMLVCTNDAGVEKTTAPTNVPDATYKFGPYMQAAPVNPLTNSSSVSAGATALGAGGLTVGWVYNTQTGEISGVNKAGQPSADGEPVVAP